MILRELLLRLGLDVDEASFAKGQLAADAIKFSLESLVATGKEVIGSLFEQAKATIEYTDNLEDASNAIGVNVTALQEMQYAASYAGIGNEELSQSFVFLARSVRAASDGSEAQQKAFSKLSVKIRDGSGQLRALDEVLEDVASGIEKMPNGVEKTALAMDLFGRSGAKMIPLLNGGRKGMEKLREEARELGFVFAEETVHVGAELADDMQRLGAVIKLNLVNAIGPLLPKIREIVLRLLEWHKANAKIIAQKLERFFDLLVRGARLVAEAFELITNNGEAVVSILGIIGAALVALNAKAISTAASSLAAWAAAAAPFAVVGASIAALLLLLDDYKKSIDPNFKGRSLFRLWKTALDDWLTPKDEPWFVVAIKQFVKLLVFARQIMLDMVFDWENHFNRIMKIIKLLPPVLVGRALYRVGEGVAGDLGKIGGGLGDAAWKIWNDPEKDYRNLAPTPQQSLPGGAQSMSPAGWNPYASFAEYEPRMSENRRPVAVSAPVQINLTTHPGQSNEQIASMINDKIDERWEASMQAAYAAVSE